MHLGHLPHEHPYGVPKAHPVQRPQVGVENKHITHRVTSLSDRSGDLYGRDGDDAGQRINPIARPSYI
ncbi:hypothetical protein Abr02nite_35120 [Paractinoplanes brasiliensis]|nr:hypothetical protein Abr02nite_35120 [Actinoplanes brasiliensis]